MSEAYNPMLSAELAAEQNTNMIDGILNNTPPPLPESPALPPDRVKEYPPKHRGRDREER